MNWLTLIGLSAAVLTTSAFVPQIIKTWKVKETKDISFGMYLIFVIGIVLWLIYGILWKDLPLIIANSVSLLFSLAILIMKIRYK